MSEEIEKRQLQTRIRVLENKLSTFERFRRFNEEIILKQSRELQAVNDRLNDEIRAKQQLIEALHAAQAQLECIALTDPLTGLFNRRHFNDVLPRELRRLQREQQPLALMMIDVDNFKRYNDAYGHQQGDHVLVGVAESLRGSVRRAGDYLFRLGGEEFGVVSAGLDRGGALEVSRGLVRAVGDLNIEHRGNHPHARVTVSVGVCVCPPERELCVRQLYASADNALYLAKAAGRNTAVLHDGEAL